VQNPYAVEVDDQMSERPLLVVGLEEDTIPGNTTKFGETLSGRNIDKTCLTPM
jgi:hypothetical protein